MSITRDWFRTRFHVALLLAAIGVALMPKAAEAVPSFTRQVGLPCSGCHTVYPEVNAFGRQFKLRGFTLGNALDDKKFPLNLPLAAVAVTSVNSTRNRTDVEPETIDRDGKPSLQMAGIYYGGRIAGNLGALAQYNYEGIEKKWGVEMIDVRYADAATLPGGRDLIWGITLNNSPTLADIYNSTPMWSFPHLTTEKVVMPAASALVDMMLFRQVGGVGVYGFWNNLIYGEVALYRTTNSGFLRALGQGAEKVTIVDGYAPYWRLAVERIWGAHEFEVGAFGFAARVYPEHDNLSTPTNRFRDLGFDAQYHFSVGEHLISAHAIYIRERQRWNASLPMGLAANGSAKLTTTRGDVHYFFQRKFGAGVQHFSTRGDEDQLRYNTGEPVMGSASGRPDTRGWQFELLYLPVQQVKVGLRYTAYERFNGGKTNYDGFGRNAKDNNTSYLYAWILF